MKALKRRAQQFLISEAGPTATEYAIMLSLIVLASMGGLTLLSGKINSIFTNLQATLPNGA